MKKKINLLILGSGMFTTGRGTKLFGTIIPSILEESLMNGLENVVICSTTIQSSKKAEKKVNQLLKIYNTKINISYYPNKNKMTYRLTDIVKKHKCNYSQSYNIKLQILQALMLILFKSPHYQG